MFNAEQIKQIIDNSEEQIHPYAQPIVSVRDKNIRGFEFLSRFILDQQLVAPSPVFAAAEKHNLALELDRSSRKRAFKAFKAIHDSNEHLIMFFNFNTSLIDKTTERYGHLAQTIEFMQIDPGRVVIEILESRAQNTQALLDFVAFYREKGFIIALDDIGSGYSSFERIALIKPDIIKIDRSLVNDIHRHYHKTEIVRSLVSLAHKTGALVVAEGIETENEAVTVLDIGADFLQGFYFARPAPADQPPKADNLTNTAALFLRKRQQYLIYRSEMQQHYSGILRLLTSKLVSVGSQQVNEQLKSLINDYAVIECGYILSSDGMQLGETIAGRPFKNKNRKKIYYPASSGTDHSLKEYYLPLINGARRFFTEPYISSATGQTCVTGSAPFETSDNRSFILCIDFLNLKEKETR